MGEAALFDIAVTKTYRDVENQLRHLKALEFSIAPVLRD
jgi:hypothetical protein